MAQAVTVVLFEDAMEIVLRVIEWSNVPLLPMQNSAPHQAAEHPVSLPAGAPVDANIAP